MKNILNKLRKWWRLVNLAASSLEMMIGHDKRIETLLEAGVNTIDALRRINGKLENLNQGLRRLQAANKDEESARQRDVVDIRALIAEIQDKSVEEFKTYRQERLDRLRLRPAYRKTHIFKFRQLLKKARHAWRMILKTIEKGGSK